MAKKQKKKKQAPDTTYIAKIQPPVADPKKTAIRITELILSQKRTQL